jgi:LPPG:FO 2-phospho-L-lactate transferase
LIEEGKTLTEVTENLCSVLKAGVKLLPMSDDPVSSILKTDQGEMHFQAFWAGWKGKPEVESIEFRGSETAKATRLVVDALKNEVIIGPSNPVTSIGPILSLEGVEELLSETKVVAVSPFIGGESFSGPIKKLMIANGYDANTAGLMEMYPFVDAFVIDSTDKTKMDRPVVKTNIRIDGKVDAVRVYESCLKAFEEVDKK